MFGVHKEAEALFMIFQLDSKGAQGDRCRRAVNDSLEESELLLIQPKTNPSKYSYVALWAVEQNLFVRFL